MRCHALLAPVLASARAAGVHVVRGPLERLDADVPAHAKRLVLEASWHMASRTIDADSGAMLERSPDFRGIGLQGSADVEQKLLALLDQLPDRTTTEIMLHPGHDDAVLAAQDPYRAEREREVSALTSSAARARLNQGGIELVTIRDVVHTAQCDVPLIAFASRSTLARMESAVAVQLGRA
jgi:predicted glycoside hydrolase/deacetylase ChbG (UPF0249 family)